MHVLKLDSDGLFFFPFVLFLVLPEFLCAAAPTRTQPRGPFPRQTRIAWPEAARVAPRPVPVSPPSRSHLCTATQASGDGNTSKTWDDAQSLAGGYCLFLRKKKNTGKKKQTWNSCVRLDVETGAVLALIQTLLKFFMVISLASVRFGSGLASRCNGRFQQL